jgi:zinc transporter, ZIP family
MQDLTPLIACTLGAGACIPLGGALASVERIRRNWLENEFRHFVIAFGGGVLLAAVAFVLVPQGAGHVGSPWGSVPVLLAGGGAFFALERFLAARRQDAPQFSAMLLDYVPESLALGGAFALGTASAPLLAFFIGLQNLPEGFNAYREMMRADGADKRRILLSMCLLVPLGPLLALFGWAVLKAHATLLGAIMLFASGGILYLIFQDIAPQSRMQRHWAPPLGAVFGFGLGMLGTMLDAG